MSSLQGIGGAPSARITAALTQSGVTDASKMNNELKSILTIDVQARSALSNLGQLSGGASGAGSNGGAASTPGAFSGGNIDMSGWEAKFDQAASFGASMDSMENQAMQLMQSPNKADQIKGQQMMQAVTQIMEALIKAIQSRGDAAKHAIDASQSH
jgi:hypothetical protein